MIDYGINSFLFFRNEISVKTDNYYLFGVIVFGMLGVKIETVKINVNIAKMRVITLITIPIYPNLLPSFIDKNPKHNAIIAKKREIKVVTAIACKLISGKKFGENKIRKPTIPINDERVQYLFFKFTLDSTIFVSSVFCNIK